MCRTAGGPGADFSVVSRHSTDVVQQVPVTNVQDQVKKDCKDERFKKRKSSYVPVPVDANCKSPRRLFFCMIKFCVKLKKPCT